MEPTGDRGRDCLLYIWHVASNGASVKEFDKPSFVGGLCFGTGFCIVFNRLMRNILLITVGGFLGAMALQHYGLITINADGLKTTVEQSMENPGSKVASAVEGIVRYASYLGRKVFGKKMAKGRVVSAILGSATGLCLGFLLF
ncbi:hypothetical protein BgAZ_209090 [Babesia gibsoni]|uniref:Uncharacterized protein n=1 Tax=Babesia gibsoni TaxID=33632 RepID=A0AAD8PET8_BABGI|nr:hypothetical protein BgAZ_209090 [Babesia gibsoni]